MGESSASPNMCKVVDGWCGFVFGGIIRVILLGIGTKNALDGASAMAVDTSLMCIGIDVEVEVEGGLVGPQYLYSFVEK